MLTLQSLLIGTGTIRHSLPHSLAVSYIPSGTVALAVSFTSREKEEAGVPVGLAVG